MFVWSPRNRETPEALRDVNIRAKHQHASCVLTLRCQVLVEVELTQPDLPCNLSSSSYYHSCYLFCVLLAIHIHLNSAALLH